MICHSLVTISYRYAQASLCCVLSRARLTSMPHACQVKASVLSILQVLCHQNGLQKLTLRLPKRPLRCDITTLPRLPCHGTCRLKALSLCIFQLLYLRFYMQKLNQGLPKRPLRYNITRLPSLTCQMQAKEVQETTQIRHHDIA